MEIYREFKRLGLNPNKVRRCTTINKKTKKQYVWYRFDMSGDKNILQVNKILLTRHPKHIQSFRKWLEIKSKR